MSAILLAGMLASCDQQETAQHEPEVGNKVEPRTVAEPVANDGPMSLEEFKGRLIAILTSTRQMGRASADEIHLLCENLHPELVDQLFDLATEQPPEGLRVENWYFGYNQILIEVGDRMGEVDAMHKLAMNPEVLPVIRDYASQHYLRNESRIMNKLNVSADSEECLRHLNDVIEKTSELVKAGDENSQSMPGTALLGFVALASDLESHPAQYQMIQQAISSMAMLILENPGNHSSITYRAAMQAASRMKIKQAGTIILDRAMDQSAPTFDRLNAIGSLHSYPELVDGESLLSSIPANQKTLRQAADSLLAKLQD